MARQQSSSELAGSLAATLTPSAPRAIAQLSRANQNSGLFDVRALYAETLHEVTRRTRSDPRLESLARSAQPTWSRAAQWSPPRRALEPDAGAPLAFTKAPEVRRSKGLGWFGVLVAWLATVTMGASIATTLPGHALTHLRSRATAATVATPPSQPSQTASPATVTAPLPAIAAVVLPAAVFPASSAPAASPSFPVPPQAPASLVRPVVQADASRATPKKLPPRTAAPVVHVRPAASADGASSAPPASAVATTPRVAAPSRTGSATPAAPTSASTAGMSLDELIRHEVQMESAKHH